MSLVMISEGNYPVYGVELWCTGQCGDCTGHHQVWFQEVLVLGCLCVYKASAWMLCLVVYMEQGICFKDVP